jgi:hypothetical protein
MQQWREQFFCSRSSAKDPEDKDLQVIFPPRIIDSLDGLVELSRFYEEWYWMGF